jgi:glutathione synthase/RimK-type ligase-like ATP-grasp enzyme
VRVALVTCADLPGWEVDDRPLVPALAALGVQGVDVAWDADFDWSSVDGVWIRTTWDYTRRLEAFLAWVDTVSDRLLIPGPLIRWNADKRYLRDLEEAGVPLAPTAWLAPGEDPGPAVRSAGWKRAFLKPVVGASAEGTLRFTCDSSGLEAARRHVASDPRPMMLQPYLGSVEDEGEVSVILVDGRITHAVRKIPLPGDYRVQDDHGAADQPLGLVHGEDEFARRVLTALQARFRHLVGNGHPLVARVDTLRDTRGQLVLNELELIEPSLFLRHGPGVADALARAVAERLAGRTGR